MLQEHCGSERLDVTFAAACRAAHFTHRAQGGGRGEPLVN
jgi:hypothetical protein